MRSAPVIVAADLVTPAGLHEVASYADGIGVNKNLIIPRDATGALLALPPCDRR
jgi:glycerophosphoryl diester phosphodiesterase